MAINLSKGNEVKKNEKDPEVTDHIFNDDNTHEK